MHHGIHARQETRDGIGILQPEYMQAFRRYVLRVSSREVVDHPDVETAA